MSFKILSINELDGTMVVDWGWTTINHNIPNELLGDEDLHPEEIKRIIKSMEPEKPIPSIVNKTLLGMVEPIVDTHEEVIARPNYNEDVSDDDTIEEI